MTTCAECGRPLFTTEWAGVCGPCVLDEARRHDRVAALGQIAAPGRQYFTELHAHIQHAFEARHG